jgi:hypothetical protein
MAVQLHGNPPAPARLLSAVVLLGAMLHPPARAANTDFAPLDVPADGASVHLRVTGTYRGGMYSTRTPAAPPGYAPATRRLFLGSDDRHALEALDISDPARPRKIFQIDLTDFGGAPDSLAVAAGIVAVTVENPDQPAAPKQLLLFDTDGKPVADPIALAGARRMVFTPDADRLLVGLDGQPGRRAAGVAIIHPGHVDHLACRAGTTACRLHPTVRIVDFGAFDRRMVELKAAGVRVLSKGSPISQDLSVTTLAVAPDSRSAWINLQENNAVAVLDLDTAEIRQVYGLPYKDHSLPGNGLDASDKDGAIAIRPWPIRALYQPDGLAAFESMGQVFFATANEGDPRHFDHHDESARVMNLELDPVRFSDAALLQRESNLGRLHVSTLIGDTDDDGDYDALYAFGGRSFSIWTPDAGLVFDSGDEMERIIASALPDDFNVSESANDFDARSDSRGPEPEHLAVGKIGSQVYAFIAFERIGGVMVYDITDPRRPRFQQYINNRNFAVDPRVVCGDKGREQIAGCARAGDLEPEGLLFISAGDSPIGVPMLVVIHELSDSTTLYRIDRLTP